MEKLTIDIALTWTNRNLHKIKDKKIFINSILGQIFTESDIKEMRCELSNLSHAVVFEIAENEFSSKEDTIKKVELFRDFGAMIAVDDYGFAYSNELANWRFYPLNRVF